MQIQYLEIVTQDVDAVCAAYAAANGIQFGKPDAALGNAQTVELPGGALVVTPRPAPSFCGWSSGRWGESRLQLFRLSW